MEERYLHGQGKGKERQGKGKERQGKGKVEGGKDGRYFPTGTRVQNNVAGR